MPRVPRAHPLVACLVGTLRRQYLDQLLYWNTGDLEQKREWFKDHFDAARGHQGLGEDTPEEKAGCSRVPVVSLAHYLWQNHCHGLF